jgi:hypothetical protein
MTQSFARPVWQDTDDGKRRLVFNWSWLGVYFESGWVTDGITCPWLFRWYVRKIPRLIFAAYIHDRCLEYMPRKEAAAKFAQACYALGIDRRKVRKLYLAIRLNDKIKHHE